MSLCKYCHSSIIWVSKPNGGWYPPFNATDEIKTIDYEIRWSESIDDWIAAPVDKDLSLKLSPHECKIRQEKQSLPPEPESIVRIKLHEVTRWRNPKPEQYMRIYQRLSNHCRTCGAIPGEWCTYKDNPDEYTTDLHTTRK